jgi:excisionase family DNA binding protein
MINKNSEVKMVPLVHTIPEACSGAKIGRTALYEAIRSGALRAVKRGKRTLILDEDLRQWVYSLPQLEAKAATNARNRVRCELPKRAAVDPALSEDSAT